MPWLVAGLLFLNPKLSFKFLLIFVYMVVTFSALPTMLMELLILLSSAYCFLCFYDTLPRAPTFEALIAGDMGYTFRVILFPFERLPVDPVPTRFPISGGYGLWFLEVFSTELSLFFLYKSGINIVLLMCPSLALIYIDKLN